MRSCKKPYALIAAVFLASRCLAYAAGVKFMYGTINDYVQVLDPLELKHHLLESIFYLHAQPPLFNFLIGLYMKLFGEGWHVAAQVDFLAMGLAINLMLFRMLYLLRLPQILALAGCLIYTVAPSQIVYENYFFYTTPTAFLVLLCTWAIFELHVARDIKWAHVAVWAMAALCLMRSSYHIALFVLPLVILWRIFGVRRAAQIVSLPFLLVLLWYVKNFMLFGFFGASSWTGMNLANVAVRQLPEAQKQELYQATHSLLVFTTPFRDGGCVPSAEVAMPVLNAPCKSTGFKNFNHVSILELSNQYALLSAQAIRIFPASYLQKAAVGALVLTPTPSERLIYVEDNVAAIRTYADWYDLLVWGAPYLLFPQAWDPGEHIFSFIPGFTILFLFPVGLMHWWLRCFERDYRRSDPMQFHGLLFTTAIVIYALTLTSLFEHVENNRFRFEWEPLMWIILMRGVAELAGVWARRKEHA